ncbi:MAG: hypothetical protein DI527_00640 [Chelatococcus sp.]|nr:MAG: hypothetical protein DI527_00640 [Chelatococcus sp.]
MNATYSSSLPFPTIEQVNAFLARFDYAAMPVRNRFTNRSTGDFGEARIGFATVETTADGFIVHETDMPLRRG